MGSIANLIRTWVTPAKFKTFGWMLPRELKKLTDDELNGVGECLSIAATMFKQELERRNV